MYSLHHALADPRLLRGLSLVRLNHLLFIAKTNLKTKALFCLVHLSTAIMNSEEYSGSPKNHLASLSSFSHFLFCLFTVTSEHKTTAAQFISLSLPFRTVRDTVQSNALISMFYKRNVFISLLYIRSTTKNHNFVVCICFTKPNF